MPSAHLPIIGDIPAPDPQLGFKEYAQAIARAICDGNPAQFTLAVYGQWGTGKSTLLLAVQRLLTAAPAVVPVFFDAWRYEETPNIGIPLVNHMVQAVKNPRHTAIRKTIGKALEGLVSNLEADFLWGTFRLHGSKAERVADAGSAFVRATEMLDELSQELVASGTRIVLLVDDLDRCRPERVVDVIEALKIMLNAPGIVSVIAMDYRRLISALSAKYENTDTNAYSFMEKIVQAEFHLPPFKLDAATYWDDLQLGQVQDPELAGIPGFRRLLHGIATDALDSNPRLIKRYLNTLLLNRRVVAPQALSDHLDAGVAQDDVQRLAAVIGFQLGYPASFQAWQRKDLTPQTEKILELLGDPEIAPAGRRVADPQRNISAKEYVEKYLKPWLHDSDLRAAQVLTDRLTKVDTSSWATDLIGQVRVRVAWERPGPGDLSAFLISREQRVEEYESFVYYNNRRSFDRAVSHRGDSGSNGTVEEIDVDLDAIDSKTDSIVFALSVHQGFADTQASPVGLATLGPITLTVHDIVDGRELAAYAVEARFTGADTGAVIARADRVGQTRWSFSQTTRAYQSGLVGIGRDYGVDLA